MTQAAPPLKIPESMGPAEIGPYLREVREYFKLSPQDVSERLHIRVRYVTAMEEGRFDAMPGKVYARGYLHTYAEFLGLDADQVVAQCFAVVAAAPVAAPVVLESIAAKPAAPVIAKPAPYLPPPLPPKAVGGAKPLWRSLWLPVLLVVLAFAGYNEFFSGEDEDEADTAPVTTQAQPAAAAPAPVQQPEALLTPVYSEVMPTPRNYDCLGIGRDEDYLDCVFPDGAVADYDGADYAVSAPFVRSLMRPAAVQVKPANLKDSSEYEREN